MRGKEGIVAKAIFPKEPRYENAAPVAIYVAGGVKEGFLGFYSADWDPHGMIWITFIFPGGNQSIILPTKEEINVRSGGEYDYRGDACFEALYAVIKFAKGEIANTAGKKITDYVSYDVLKNNIGLYGSSYGGITAALTLAKYGDVVNYLVFYESPPLNLLTTTDWAGSAAMSMRLTQMAKESKLRCSLLQRNHMLNRLFNATL